MTKADNIRIHVNHIGGQIYKLYKDGQYEICGKLNEGGYIWSYVKGVHVANHRYIMESYLGRKLKKDEEINHRNHIRHDNRYCNLEIVSSKENSQYTRARPNSQFGFKHISWFPDGRCWRVRIHENVDGKIKCILKKCIPDIRDAIKFRNDELTRRNLLGNKFYIPKREDELLFISKAEEWQRQNGRPELALVPLDKP
jgi:hypothetical protein